MNEEISVNGKKYSVSLQRWSAEHLNSPLQNQASIYKGRLDSLSDDAASIIDSKKLLGYMKLGYGYVILQTV